MKITKILSACLLSLGFISTAFAADEGFYFGADVGQATLQPGAQYVTTGSPTTVRVSANNTVYAARIFGGLQGSRYFGLEAGYTYFTSPKYQNLPANVCSQPYIRLQTLDLTGKAIFPFLNTLWNIGLEGFVKAGIAGAYVSKAGSLEPVVDGTGCGYGVSTMKILPVLGFGISYHAVNLKCGQFLC